MISIDYVNSSFNSTDNDSFMFLTKKKKRFIDIYKLIKMRSFKMIKIYLMTQPDPVEPPNWVQIWIQPKKAGSNTVASTNKRHIFEKSWVVGP